MGELNHECGVAAVYHAAGEPVSPLAPIPGDVNSVARLIPRMLLDMQNRGQLAAGDDAATTRHRDALLKTHKELGTVAEAFRLNHKAKFEAIMRGATARPRSATSATPPAAATDRSYAQPFEREHGRKAKWFAFAFNGQLANYQELKRRAPRTRATTTSSATPTPRSSCTR